MNRAISLIEAAMHFCRVDTGRTATSAIGCLPPAFIMRASELTNGWRRRAGRLRCAMEGITCR